MPEKLTTYASAVSGVPMDIEPPPSYKESQIAHATFWIDLIMKLIQSQEVKSPKLDV
jgi:hypothetical protein